jgi:EmrB/QacA subfamily drug resistance transporter
MSTTTFTPSEAAFARPTTRTAWLGFAVVVAALVMDLLDSTIAQTAAPAIRRDLGGSYAALEWISAAYTLAMAVTLLLGSRLGDIFGRRRVLLAGIGAFVLASALCSLAPNPTLLIAARGFQGVTAALMVPQGFGLIRELFGDEGQQKALGVVGPIMGLAAIGGPLVGGGLIDVNLLGTGWRAIFLVNVPIGLILIFLGRRIIPRQPRTAGERFDLKGVTLLGVALIGVMIGITNLGSPGGGAAWLGIVAPIAIGVGAGTFFVRHTQRARAPFVTPRLLYGHGFGTMNVINVLFGSAALGFSALVPLYAQDRYGISSISSGSLLIARAIGMISIASIAVLLLRRTGCRPPMIVGNLVIAAGLVTMALPAPAGVAPYWWLCATAALTGLGVGTAIPASNNAILQFAVGSIAAVAGLRGMFRQAGGILAVSVSTVVVARSAHPGTALAYLFLAFAGLLTISVPLAFLVPNHRGRI